MLPDKNTLGWYEASSSESSTEGLSISEEFDEITHTQSTRDDGKIK